MVLGHIDHGKSSLLEAIKDFKITSKESGGITQHIAAYQVEEQGKKITFLDTPGHEAFLEMRSRGAKVADIAILVVDATEGVKPQTKEAILHIKKSGVPAIVALNKIDKPLSDPEKVKIELSKEDFLVESLGGKIPSVQVSAKTKKGIPDILELILLTAEMENLTADFSGPAEGVIIESHLDNFRGLTATLLLVSGCLKTGDSVATSSGFVKVKSIEDFQKKSIKKAFPSDPVIIFGFNQPPKVGEKFKSFFELADAQNYSKNPEKAEQKKEEVTEIFVENNKQKTLSLILKADVSGSIEAIEGILNSLPQEKVSLKILKSEIGNINESDIKLALTGKIVIFGFRVKMDKTAKKMAEREKVKVIFSEIIYDLTEKVTKMMEAIADPEDERKDIGKLKVLAKFLTDKNRQIIGGRVTLGEIRKGALIDVLRDDEKIGEGKMINLQRNKKDAALISKGEECGILFEGTVSIEAGDTLSFYTIERVKKGL